MNCQSCGQDNPEGATTCQTCGAKQFESTDLATPTEDRRFRSGAFVGRQRELSELTAALEDAISGQGRLLMLAGEPGIGKTRTAQELALRQAPWARKSFGVGATRRRALLPIGLGSSPSAPISRSGTLTSFEGRWAPEPPTSPKSFRKSGKSCPTWSHPLHFREEGHLLADLGVALGLHEDDDEGTEVAFDRALAIARREGDAALEMRTLGHAARVYQHQGRMQDALQKSLLALELAPGPRILLPNLMPTVRPATS